MLRALLCAAFLMSHFSWLTCPAVAQEQQQKLTIGGNVYGGGNKGNLGGTTSVTINSGKFGVHTDGTQSDGGNIFGGARMAEVNENQTPLAENQYAANVTFNGGEIRADRAVYGGNDITGDVHGGTRVDILASVGGSVYGGGNGSYEYTDKDNTSDFYYNPGTSSIDALNKHRPNVEKTYVHIAGNAPTTVGEGDAAVTTDHTTYIGGSVYCGGNSATLRPFEGDNTSGLKAHLQLGSYAVIDKVFLGSNGENMVTGTMLSHYKDDTKSSLNLTDASIFSKYMDGVSVVSMPAVDFDSNYEPYSTMLGSLYCGGNVGSMKVPGTTTINLNYKVVIYDKIVGGSNNANVDASSDNAAYQGGLLGADDEQASFVDGSGNIKNRLELNLNGPTVRPMRWNSAGTGLEWNTIAFDNTLNKIVNVNPVTSGSATTADVNDQARRLKGGNIYGGCYSSGHVNGNVVININSTLHEPDILFDAVESKDKLNNTTDRLYDIRDDYTITARRTGVALHKQGMDPLGQALNVFGGGYGEDSEIWGSATVNLYKGYTFQIFGGGENGIIGKKPADYNPDNDNSSHYDAHYSTFVNLSSHSSEEQDMAEAVFIYGGGFQGDIMGDVVVHLDDGRLFNSFTGSCDADILGHTETYVGSDGFPYVTDHIYGANDLGGTIYGSKDFTSRVSSWALPKIYGYDASNQTSPFLNVSSYVEYKQGHVDYIFGGCFGDYDYNSAEYARINSPKVKNVFVNFNPTANNSNSVNKVFGGSQGGSGVAGKDQMQERSYVLVDIPQEQIRFSNTEVFGAGAYAGLGMGKTPAEAKADPDNASAIIDLVRGQISAAYGGSYSEGVTRRTMVNVPAESTIKINNIFGGAYGTEVLPPCDVYESNVNYNNTAETASVGTIYGGNNNQRRTIYAHVNINAPVWSDKARGYLATVYGAGKGFNTWAEYTEVNLNNTAYVYQVYGGGEEGHVLNAETVQNYLLTGRPLLKAFLGLSADITDADWMAAWTLGEGYFKPTVIGDIDTYANNAATNLTNTSQVREAEMDDRDYTGYTDEAKARNYKRYNTNVLIKEGATVMRYAYGGGLGSDETMSGDVYGSTYIALLGGKVTQDIYAGGTSGSVHDHFFSSVGRYDASSKPFGFTASANAYIKGGTVRNVYGAGWKGDVGYHPEGASTADDMLGETHVVIGDIDGTSFTNGIPAIQRNAYAGGEGQTFDDGSSVGSTVYGTANIKLYNGYIGYTYNSQTDEYEEKLHDETATDYVSEDNIVGKNRLVEAGNIFGSGYVDHSNVDVSNVKMYGGVVRNSLYGGGEIGVVGRGTKDLANNGAISIQKPGETHVTMYGGHVIRDVFGGGRGFDNLNRSGALQTAGYIFGSTEVNIHRGTIGTESSIADGHGNVFGGGNLGYVYSGKGTKRSDGYYYGTDDKLTEDCKVIISPYCLVEAATSINGHDYVVGDYVPTTDLNTLSAQDPNWKTKTGGNLDDLGITIGNAVFAGGNVSDGSDVVYANTETVFGNATASVTDVFSKDFIAIGADGIGGLYGDGNLTFVDGYRELNVTNYGTDYYNLNSSLEYNDYLKLNDRERAYFQLQYQPKAEFGEHRYDYYRSKSWHTYEDNQGNTIAYHINQKITGTTYATLSEEEQGNWVQESHTYKADDKISEDEWNLMDTDEQAKWDLYGFCTLYAGRILNTIQRADFCGVFGSRIVFRGAQDRVPSVVDYTNYTINRVDEVSLNQVKRGTNEHGNYFGIYSVVNYLGALTSDVKFTDTRTTDNSESAYTPDPLHESYYAWKEYNLLNRKRNNGSCANEVALSSGVWLEILDKETETRKEKVYGPITGVVELALINVAPGEGGGYVYAKNEHGALVSSSSASQVTLSEANRNAVSYKQYTYNGGNLQKMQTSGNFINSTKRIVDDCYPLSGTYTGENASPAHYWYIRGDFYLYDQYISAYTGSAQAYAEKVSIPLTITAESQGKLELKSINENLFAYWTDNYTNLSDYKSQTDPTAIVVNNITYHQNDPISYWDYSRLNATERTFFQANTYVSMEDMTLSTVTYTKGQVLTEGEYGNVPEDEYVCTTGFTTDGMEEYPHGTVLTQSDYEALAPKYQEHFETAKSLVHPSNALSHDNGFLLSFAWDNPNAWNDYYRHEKGIGTPQLVHSTEYNSESFAYDKEDYTTSPTFKCNTSGVYGQMNYSTGALIDKVTYDYEASVVSHNLPNQANFEEAYVAKEDCEFTIGSTTYNYVKGAPISATLYGTLGTYQSHFEVGYICTETYKVSDTEYILSGDLLTQTAYTDAVADLKKVLSKAYVCTSEGAWGGRVFEAGNNYPAIYYSNLSKEERANFSYNYDALDLLSEDFKPTPENENMTWYQGNRIVNSVPIIPVANQIPYAMKQSIDYTATYGGGESGAEEKTLSSPVSVTHANGTTTTTSTLVKGDVLKNTVYEGLLNEQFRYTPIVVSSGDNVANYYVVKEGFQYGDNWYNVGNKISADIYNGLNTNLRKNVIEISSSSLPDKPTGENQTKNYYFCTSSYKANTPVTNIVGTSATYNSSTDNVPVGTIITAENYGNLKNEQTGFTIDGTIPTETSTLYVSREVDINDLSQDKIITVEYWYEYVESDGEGSSYETIRERHVVNVHVHFESGVPIIGELLPPKTILPGNVVGLNQPSVTKGAYEILGGGWETYSSLTDATSHKNGTPYTNNNTKMYWYQDGYYVAYYAKTYLGKTFSNAVQFSVGNYHDIADVMADKDHHMYIDHPSVKRHSKIYIDNEENTTDKSELDMFTDLFTLSTQPQTANEETGIIPTVTVDGTAHTGLNSHVKDCANLDFILSSDVAPKKYTNWTSIGTDTNPFKGWLHGNGFTVSGLNNSLFGTIDGANIYNIGVMGSFTKGGIADKAQGAIGHIENTWVSTTATPAGKPIIDTPSDNTYVFNSYYPEEQHWTAHAANTKLNTIERPMADFVNGQVAYDLNSNYLQARYRLFGDHDGNGETVQVFYSLPDGSMVKDPNNAEQNKAYPFRYDAPSDAWPWHSGNGFVENYMGNGDFRYSDGIVPTQTDVSYTGSEIFTPVFPDDYIYFGQVLSYDLYDTAERPAHDSHPTGVAKDHTTKTGDIVDNSRHMLLTLDDKKSNRLYRAPAYFRNSTFGKSVIFNDKAAFTDSYTVGGTAYAPHKGLTAIDFTGKGDVTSYQGVVPGAATDYEERGDSYKPLLDYFGLKGIMTSGITQNLLAYTPAPGRFTDDDQVLAATAATNTNIVLNNYFSEPEYSEGDYRTVAAVNSYAMSAIKGHLVQLNGSYKAMNDHLLVDKQDFNAPIAYNFDSTKRMWYQRTPENYADLDKGWEVVSLPFKAELVTTQEKGEISHFYNTGTGDNQAVGHEYWLREFKGNLQHEEGADEGVYKADFNYPRAVSDASKTYDNTFLWDYYYSKESFMDRNNDEYQKDYYYQNERTFNGYPYAAAATPYLIGFPGSTYYEFDLSGRFEAKNTKTSIPKLDRQVITFASDPGIEVKVSDTELASGKVTPDGCDYTFVPSYLNTEVETAEGYLLNGEGNSFDKTTTKTIASAFRPYFEKKASSARTRGPEVEHIIFGSPRGDFGVEDTNDLEGSLIVTPGKGFITVKSAMKRLTVDVRIVNVAGITMTSFSLAPGESVTTRLYPAVYIVAGKKYVVK